MLHFIARIKESLLSLRDIETNKMPLSERLAKFIYELCFNYRTAKLWEYNYNYYYNHAEIDKRKTKPITIDPFDIDKCAKEFEELCIRYQKIMLTDLNGKEVRPDEFANQWIKWANDYPDKQKLYSYSKYMIHCIMIYIFHLMPLFYLTDNLTEDSKYIQDKDLTFMLAMFLLYSMILGYELSVEINKSIDNYLDYNAILAEEVREKFIPIVNL